MREETTMPTPIPIADLVAGWRAIASGQPPPRSGSPAGNRADLRTPDLDNAGGE